MSKEALRDDEVEIVLCPRHGERRAADAPFDLGTCTGARSEGTLHPHDIQSVLKVARHERYANRAELLVVLSTTLGLRASELTRIAIKDVYTRDGSVLGIGMAQFATKAPPGMYFETGGVLFWDETVLPRRRNRPETRGRVSSPC